MDETPRISDAEWEVMRVLWDRHPQTAQEIVGRLDGRRAWNARTVKTLLSRLVKKRALTFDVDGNRYLYAPTVSRDECVRAESESFLDRVFDGATSPLLAHFLEKGSLEPQEIDRLRRLLDQLEDES